MTPSRDSVVVTGGGGFVGSHVVLAACRQGLDVAAIEHPSAEARGLRLLSALGGRPVPCAFADLSLRGAWTYVLDRHRPAVLVLAHGSVARGATAGAWDACLRSNVHTTAELLRAIAGLPPERRPVVVAPGSQMEYGLAPSPWTESSVCTPSTAYGASKLIATQLLAGAAREGSLRAMVLRFPLVFGPGQAPDMLLPALILAALRREAGFDMTPGEQRRCVVLAEDAARQMLAAAALLRAGAALPAVVNARCLGPFRMRDLAEAALRETRSDTGLRLGALPYRAEEPLDAFPDDGLAARLSLPAPAPLPDALASTVAWYRENLWYFSRRSESL